MLIPITLSIESCNPQLSRSIWWSYYSLTISNMTAPETTPKLSQKILKSIWLSNLASCNDFQLIVMIASWLQWSQLIAIHPADCNVFQLIANCDHFTIVTWRSWKWSWKSSKKWSNENRIKTGWCFTECYLIGWFKATSISVITYHRFPIWLIDLLPF